jgi:hypothetical protein
VGLAPEVVAFGGSVVFEFVHPTGNDSAGEGKGPVGLAWVGVLEKEDLEGGGLFTSLVGETAGARFEAIGIGRIAGAHVDSGDGREAGDTEN